MAIDYGSKRIGIALSDPLRMFAKPLLMIPNTNEEDVLAGINNLVAEHEVGLVILGIPYALEGQNTPKTDEVLLFKTILEASVQVPVIGWNESLSTNEANQHLKSMGYDWKKSRSLIDAMAACMILKSYLESN